MPILDELIKGFQVNNRAPLIRALLRNEKISANKPPRFLGFDDRPLLHESVDFVVAKSELNVVHGGVGRNVLL